MESEARRLQDNVQQLMTYIREEFSDAGEVREIPGLEYTLAFTSSPDGGPIKKTYKFIATRRWLTDPTRHTDTVRDFLRSHDVARHLRADGVYYVDHDVT